MRGHPATRLLLLAALALSNAHALQLYGCSLADDLCEPQEECFPDGLFGQCHSELTGVAAPSILPDLEPLQLELLRLEITRLQNSGVEWQDQQAQCVLAYFKLSASYDLQYDPNFCDVQTPANIWALIQLVEMGLNEPQPEPEEEAIVVEEVPSEVLSELAAEAEAAEEAAEEEAQAEAADADVDADAVDVSDGELAAIISQLNQPPPALVLQEDPSDDSDPVVDSYVEQLVSEGDPDIALLSDDQLDELIGRIIVLKNQTADGEQDDGGEEEEAVPVPDVGSDDQAAVKKDVEKATPVDTGLQGKEHNIVKGRRAAVSRVVGNRVYLKVDIKNEEQLYPLVEFLQNTIALPNNLLFDDFQFHNGQLSLRISRLPQFDEKPQNEKRIDTVEGVAQAVYKRRKDIQRLSGAAVEETGIGIGDDSVPVERSDRDWIVMPVMFVCAFTIAALVSVMAVHVIKRRRSHYGANISRLGEAVDGKSCQAYEDLCRQRMSEEGVAAAARTSKTSSTSSWSEDEAKKSNIDISTGHVILNFLQEYINDGDRITEQWEQIRGYKASKPTVTAAAKETRAGAVLPYDETLVPVNSWDDAAEPPFLNASFLHDDDPRQAAYVVCTTPDDDDVTAFWQAVWQHGVCLVVNLSSAEEVLQSRIYWPATGSITHGPFEIHLVSEHIWSDDYVVRSFYLKHLRGGQTRTITQFHYLSWPTNAVPSSPKSLLDFRRKVAKSYRGEGSPLLVHSARGAGRAGVYCAVDSLCNRLHRGVKEIDVAASVEHLRDQRAELVQTADQYKTIYACVAAEVSALVRALQ